MRPEVDHALPFAEQRQVAQEGFAEELEGLEAHLGDAVRVGLVDLRLQQLVDRQEEDLAEGLDPFHVL